MRVTGYSERGAINALFWELAYSKDALHLLGQLLALAGPAVAAQFGTGLTAATVLIDQSLSDFGDADAILLLTTRSSKSVVFLEAKVKSSQAETWTLTHEFCKFDQGCRTDRKLSSSNLFTQLYNKGRFIEGLRSGGIELLQKGLSFPACSTKALRKIGSNPVVLSAVKKIEPYRESAWYLSLVPDKESAVRDFFDHRFSTIACPLGSGGWKASRWSGVAWEQVAEFCDAEKLRNTRYVLDFNGGQIC